MKPLSRPQPLASLRRFLLALLLALPLCGASPAWAERQLIDAAGRRVTVADRIERVYAMGHAVPVVAAVAPAKLLNTFNVSERARRYLSPALVEGKWTSVGGKPPTDEEILRLSPQVIVMENNGNAAEQAQRLQDRLKLPVFLVDQDLSRCKTGFAMLGELLGEPAQSRRMADFVWRRIDPLAAVAATIPQERRIRVYYAEGPDGLSTNPAGSAHTQVIEYVGAINAAQVAAAPGEGMSTVNLEQLYLWQPELILAWTPNADQLTTWRAITTNPLWQRIDAVRQGRVVQIPWLPMSWFDRPPGSNRLIGVPWLAQRLYPDIYRLDMVAILREYVRIFYHTELSEADARALLATADPAAATQP